MSKQMAILSLPLLLIRVEKLGSDCTWLAGDARISLTERRLIGARIYPIGTISKVPS